MLHKNGMKYAYFGHFWKGRYDNDIHTSNGHELGMIWHGIIFSFLSSVAEI